MYDLRNTRVSSPQYQRCKKLCLLRQPDDIRYGGAEVELMNFVSRVPERA
jgi:hypothetical protein